MISSKIFRMTYLLTLTSRDSADCLAPLIIEHGMRDHIKFKMSGELNHRSIASTVSIIVDNSLIWETGPWLMIIISICDIALWLEFIFLFSRFYWELKLLNYTLREIVPPSENGIKLVVLFNTIKKLYQKHWGVKRLSFYLKTPWRQIYKLLPV